MTVRITQPSSYRIISRLDVGGMAEVFLAEQVWGDSVRRVALKRLLPALDRDPQYRALFLEEARVAASLRHAAIPAVYELLDSLDPPALSMEWVRGVSLRELQAEVRSGKSTPFSVAEVRVIAAELLDVLSYLSSLRDENGNPAPLYHRDLAPENILIDASGRVRLIDFGIAKSSASRLATETGILKGRLAYLPPEVAHGQPFGPTGDLYALGLILTELLTGTLPGYESDQAKQLVSLRDRSGPPELPDSLPGREQFARILESDPAKRPASPAECAALIELALGRGALPGDGAHDLKARAAACLAHHQPGASAPEVSLYWGETTPVIPQSTETPPVPGKPAVLGRIMVALTIVLVAVLSWTYENHLWIMPWEPVIAPPSASPVTLAANAVAAIPAPPLPLASLEIRPAVNGELLVSGVSKGLVSGPVLYELPQGAYTLELRSPPDRFYRADLFLKAGEKTVWAPADSPAWK